MAWITEYKVRTRRGRAKRFLVLYRHDGREEKAGNSRIATPRSRRGNV